MEYWNNGMMERNLQDVFIPCIATTFNKLPFCHSFLIRCVIVAAAVDI